MDKKALTIHKITKEPSLPTTRWRIPPGDPEGETRLVRELHVHPLLSRILVNRSLADPDEARRYLQPSLNDLHNPFLMKDIRKGLKRLIGAIMGREKIVIYGDYDVDGITSLVILYDFLQKTGADVSYYIPHRTREGYGLNRTAVDAIRDKGAALLITVDCGISDHSEIIHARSMGIETIVLDHHEIPESLPAAEAVINTQRSDCLFPFKPLAGVGTVFNFLIALRGQLREIGFWANRPYPNLREYLDLVALGTIGDISPLVDENRIFAKIGLDLINQGGRPGIQALREVSGSGHQPVDSTTASFSLIPRINAAGRISSAEDAISLLLEKDPATALRLARKLDGLNRDRQIMERSILNAILNDIKTYLESDLPPVFVFASRDWHPGVIGIVASRLVEMHYRPAILISLKDGIGKGSGRSIPEFNLHRGLTHCQPYLLSYGGHRFAGGLSIREEDILPFRSMMEQIVREDVSLTDLVPTTAIDAHCELEDISCDLVCQLESLAPYGSMNPEPILHARQVTASHPSVVGNNHLKMRVTSRGAACPSIWFGRGHFAGTLQESDLEIIFTPQLNYWNGTSTIQLKLKDIAKSR
jgi:single-stranded-DNA-specific exonuclease